MSKVDRYREYAENARARAEDAHSRARQTLDDIPMGQPVLLGHHSQARHEKALGQSNALMRTAYEESKKADAWTARAENVERREASKQARIEAFPEGINIGDEVTARFTNMGYARSFRGVVVGRNKNDWKVRALTSPYPEEEPGRVFLIPAAGSRKHSPNNCITPS